MPTINLSLDGEIHAALVEDGRKNFRSLTATVRFVLQEYVAGRLSASSTSVSRSHKEPPRPYVPPEKAPPPYGGPIKPPPKLSADEQARETRERAAYLKSVKASGVLDEGEAERERIKAQVMADWPMDEED